LVTYIAVQMASYL